MHRSTARTVDGSNKSGARFVFQENSVPDKKEIMGCVWAFGAMSHAAGHLGGHFRARRTARGSRQRSATSDQNRWVLCCLLSENEALFTPVFTLKACKIEFEGWSAGNCSSKSRSIEYYASTPNKGYRYKCL